MTETREVDYARLAAKARKLFRAIHDQMDLIANREFPVQADAWCELHDLAKITGGLLGQLNRIQEREREASWPVPYTVDGYKAWAADHARPIGDGS